MSKKLTVRAGRRAIEQIRDRGWQADDVRSLLGASGGPKWLVLSCIDRIDNLASRMAIERRKRLLCLRPSRKALT